MWTLSFYFGKHYCDSITEQLKTSDDNQDITDTKQINTRLQINQVKVDAKTEIKYTIHSMEVLILLVRHLS
jgi:hypothetical protein